MWQKYVIPATLQEALELLSAEAGKARIVAGGTDLLLEMERGVRKGIETLVDISRLDGLDRITLGEDGLIHLGAMVTHNHVASSRLLHEKAFPLVQAAWQVGSPQIRNRGTVAGNLITASPANDTITPLVAMGASLTLQSVSRIRSIPISQFYTGVRKNVMQPDEILVDIAFPALPVTSRGMFIKYALRKAQAISLLNLAVILDIQEGKVAACAITLGAVAPTIIHANAAEKDLIGKSFESDLWEGQVADLVCQAIHPIDDIRSSAAYRDAIVKVMFKRGLQALVEGKEKEGIPEQPVLLWGKTPQNPLLSSSTFQEGSEITTRINGKEVTLAGGQAKTLLRFLREDAGLVGIKEGCAEGECGACTIFLDGRAVMACLVPAPRAHGAEITSIEGISSAGELHPVQQAFIDEGAVQCGYCTPGFVMSAVKLLEEVDHPNRDQIKQAITGNLCRCTGYYKIVDAIEKASEVQL